MAVSRFNSNDGKQKRPSNRQIVLNDENKTPISAELFLVGAAASEAIIPLLALNAKLTSLLYFRSVAWLCATTRRSRLRVATVIRAEWQAPSLATRGWAILKDCWFTWEVAKL